MESADKPDSVACDDLSTRPTRRLGEQRRRLPIRPCFKRGLHGRLVTQTPGELLPHHFTLAWALGVRR